MKWSVYFWTSLRRPQRKPLTVLETPASQQEQTHLKTSSCARTATDLPTLVTQKSDNFCGLIKISLFCTFFHTINHYWLCSHTHLSLSLSPPSLSLSLSLSLTLSFYYSLSVSLTLLSLSPLLSFEGYGPTDYGEDAIVATFSVLVEKIIINIFPSIEEILCTTGFYKLPGLPQRSQI